MSEHLSVETLSPPAADAETAWAFAPASVSNVACGFDVVGFALRPSSYCDGEGAGDAVELGDWVGVRPSSGPGLRLVEVHGDGGALPRRVEDNTAAVAARSVLQLLVARELLDAEVGIDLVIHKRMPISSGIGSSAASAAAAAAAVDALFAASLTEMELLSCALDGEFVASRSRHADNVAPALLGGLIAVRSLSPEPDLIALPVPSWLSCALVLPEIEVSTSAARAALGNSLPLTTAVQQSANLAALVHALHAEDSQLLSRCLVDLVAEPVRKTAVPGFDEAIAAAREAGALGGSLSGSGPAIFALCRETGEGTEVAEDAARAMRRSLATEGIASRALGARVAPHGAAQNTRGPDASASGRRNAKRSPSPMAGSVPR